MRVALFSDTFYPQVNGVARTLKRLTAHMEKRGVKYELFVPEVDDAIHYPNVNQFTSIPFFFYPECRTAIVHPRRITEQLRKFSPDIIHVATPLTMGMLGAHAAKKMNIPLVGSYHTHFDRYLTYYKLTWLHPLYWKYMKWFHSPFEKIFVPSHETKIYLEKHGLYSTVWGRGVDCELFHPRKAASSFREKYQINEKYILLFVGRLAPEKGLDTLTKVMKNLPQPFSDNVHWLIIGDGPCYHDLKQEYANLKNVTLTGYLEGEELAAAYASGDLFVFPSATETFGNVVLESLASGTPAIVANTGGVTGIVEDQHTGRICTPTDQSFIEAILEMLQNERIRFEMGKQARNYALQQSWENIFDQLLFEYEKISCSRHASVI
ncbi:glycosyltransferase family 1 protein [Bacillaceae bacterium Marseille-Q3522]|nr:glycosyltransferase family 1 protein [Bacillaceae bacterium Marseille-Q3522]